MVGIAGRSKACGTCRRRKKGCDQKRPICGQCLRSGVECIAYDPSRAFVQVHAVPRPGNSRLALLHLTHQQGPKVLSRDLTWSAFETGHFGEFWSAYLPDGKHSANDGVRLTTRGWVHTVQDLYGTSAAPRKALLGLSITTLGKMKNEKWMLESGLKFHIGAVSDMRRSLMTRSGSKTDALLATSRLLSLYELLHGADAADKVIQARNWEYLVTGEMALMMQRGPSAYATGHAHQLFLEGRQNMTIMAIKARKRTPLARPEWKILPWSCHPKSTKDHLLDAMVEIPAMFEDFDIFIKCQDPIRKEALRRDLIGDCWRCDGLLRQWLEAKSPVKAEEVGELDMDMFMSGTEEALSLAYMMSLYWGACIVTFIALRVASPALDSLPKRTDARRFCKMIAAVAPIFFSSSAGLCGSHLANFGLHTAIAYLNAADGGNMSPELETLLWYEGINGFLRSLTEEEKQTEALQRGLNRLAIDGS